MYVFWICFFWGGGNVGGKWICFALKSIGTRLSYLCACFAPNQLERQPMHAFAADDSRFHIVCIDLELHPSKKQRQTENRKVMSNSK